MVIRNGDYGTISSTLIALGVKPRDAIYQFSNGAPDQARYEDYSPMLRDILSRGLTRSADQGQGPGLDPAPASFGACHRSIGNPINATGFDCADPCAAFESLSTADQPLHARSPKRRETPPDARRHLYKLLQGARCLVTGGAGFMSAPTVIDALRAAGATVRTVDNFSTGFRHNLAHLDGRQRVWSWLRETLSDPGSLCGSGHRRRRCGVSPGGDGQCSPQRA